MTKPTLTAEAIRGAVVSTLGEISAFGPLVEGEESQAYGFEAGGEAYVVRVSHRAAGFRKDRWAAERLAGKIPIPRVVHIGRIDPGHYFCVSTREPGVIAQDCDAATLDAVAPDVAGVLDAIAACDVSDIPGYGDFDAAGGVAKFDSWASYIRHSARHDWDRYADVIDAPAARRAAEWLNDNAEDLPERHELVHGDFGGNNLLVDGGRVSAVIDWGCAVIGDRLHDLARMRFWSPWLECMRRHADHCLSMEHDPRHLRCYIVSIGLDSTAYFADAGQGPIAAAMLERTLPETLSRPWAREP